MSTYTVAGSTPGSPRAHRGRFGGIHSMRGRFVPSPSDRKQFRRTQRCPFCSRKAQCTNLTSQPDPNGTILRIFRLKSATAAPSVSGLEHVAGFAGQTITRCVIGRLRPVNAVERSRLLPSFFQPDRDQLLCHISDLRSTVG